MTAQAHPGGVIDRQHSSSSPARRMQGIRGHDRISESGDALAQAGEPGDLVGHGVDVELTEDNSAAVVDRGQQMSGVVGVAGRAAHCLAVDGSVRAVAQPPIAESSLSPSSRCNVRRRVDSHGDYPPASSAARICPEALAAHSPIAVNDRAPAKTAPTANARIVVIECRTPRRLRGSGACASAASKNPCPTAGPHRPAQQRRGKSAMMTMRAWSFC